MKEPTYASTRSSARTSPPSSVRPAWPSPCGRFFFLMIRRPPSSTLFPSTPLFRSDLLASVSPDGSSIAVAARPRASRHESVSRSEEHTSELQSPHVISYAAFCLEKTSRVGGKHVAVADKLASGSHEI